MPYAPLRPCAMPRCPNLTDRGACCVIHRPAARGYAWRKLRTQVLAEEARCRACGAPGQPADHVDHRLPRARGGTDDRANLQRLCRTCHSRKTVRYDGGFGS